jgi:nucleoside triphosphatase
MEKIPEVALGALILNDNGEIFLAKSHKWHNLWIVPGGHLEYGETFEDCIKREVKEETNLDVIDIKFLDVLESIKSPEFHNERHFVFLDFTCKTITSEVILNSELQEHKWVTPEEGLKMNINSSTRKFIETYIKSIRQQKNF